MVLMHTDKKTFGFEPEKTTERLRIKLFGTIASYDSPNCEFGPVFYDCARTIVNQFQLPNQGASKDLSASRRIEISVQGRDLEITVEFDDTDELPAEWRKRLAATIDLANGLRNARQVPKPP